MTEIEKTVTAIFGGIIAIAIVAVIVSRNSNTTSVIGAASKALSSVVAAAVNPVTTAQTNGNLGNNSFSTPGISAP